MRFPFSFLGRKQQTVLWGWRPGDVQAGSRLDQHRRAMRKITPAIRRLGMSMAEVQSGFEMLKKCGMTVDEAHGALRRGTHLKKQEGKL